MRVSQDNLCVSIVSVIASLSVILFMQANVLNDYNNKEEL
jgi:hypothetical protein